MVLGVKGGPLIPATVCNIIADPPKTQQIMPIAPVTSACYLKKNLNAPSEHPPVRGKNVKTFRWDHTLQINLKKNLHGI